MQEKKVAVIMGSDSDWPVVEKAVRQLKELGIGVEVREMSAHRTPEQAREFAVNARKNGFGAIIAAAGKAAHLAGALAANTTLPVIGIPVKSSTLDGLDALLSTVQMPSGIPVATVAIDGHKLTTGLKKFGAMLGDHVEVGCGSVLNPGTVVGRGTNIYPLSMVRGYVPEGSIYKRQGEVVEKAALVL